MNNLFDKFVAEPITIELDSETTLTLNALPFRVFGKVMRLYDKNDSDGALDILLVETLKRSPELEGISEEELRLIINDKVQIGVLLKIIEKINEVNGLNKELEKRGIKKKD